MVSTPLERIAALGGIALIVYGAAMLSTAAATILAGIMLLAGAIWRRA